MLCFVESRERVRVLLDEILVDQTLASIHGPRGVAYAGHTSPPLVDSPSRGIVGVKHPRGFPRTAWVSG